MKPSTEIFPASISVEQKAHLPLGFVIQPLAKYQYSNVPTVNYSNTTVVRCKKCRTYINPFVYWESNGRKWICNLCGVTNDTPPNYVSPLDANGIREDRDSRPELLYGSVEFIAPSEYMVRPPQQPAYLVTF